MAINTPAVVAGELITSGWGNTVRADLVSLDGRVTTNANNITAGDTGVTNAMIVRMAEKGPFANVIAGTGNDTTTAGTFGTWLTINSVLPSGVPSWAVAATITVHITNVQAITADSVYSFTATIGGGSYGTTVHGSVSMPAASSLASLSFVVPISNLSGMTGPHIPIGARREQGSGIIRASSASRASVQVLFR